MISRAIVQSAIVLMNRRMKAERELRMFVPVCSSVAGMPCIISEEGALRKHERALRSARMQRPRTTGETVYSDHAGVSRSAEVARRPYYGVGDGLGEVASTAADGVGEPASPAGATALPDIFALSKFCCHWRCKSSGPSCRGAGRSCFVGSPAVTFEGLGIRVRISSRNS